MYNFFFIYLSIIYLFFYSAIGLCILQNNKHLNAKRDG